MSGVNRSAIEHALRLARIDVVRTVRKQTDWDSTSSSVLGAAVYLVLVLAATLGGGYAGYRGGQSLAGGSLAESGAPIEIVRGILALFWLVFTTVFVVRAIGQRGTLESPEGILTVVPTREAFAGLLLAEYSFALLWVLLPSISVGVGLAVGSGTVLPIVAVPLAVLLAALTSVAVGMPLGIGIRHGATRFPVVVRHKNALIVAGFMGYFLLLSTGGLNEVMIQLFEPMQGTPPGWFADLATLGLPTVAADPLRATAAIPLALTLAALSLVAGSAVADRHWFSDPALASESSTESSASTDLGQHPPATIPDRGIETQLEPAFGVPTASLIATTWRRALRAPMKLLYAFYPLLFGAGFLAEIIRAGEVPAILPYLVLVFSAWAAGVIFTLNPLGDQGAVLSATLLSGIDGRSFVRAHLLAGLLVAIPIGTMATIVTGVLSPLETERLVLLVVGAPVVMVVSAALSVGIGMAFPRFEATSVTRSIETVIPSRWAFVLFSLHLFATAAASAIVLEPVAATLMAVLVTWLAPFGLSVSADAVELAAGIALVPLILAPIPAYRFAVRRYDRFTLA